METKRLTVNESAKFSGFKPTTVLRWIQTGKLKAVKIHQGKRYTWSINQNDLQTFLTTK